MRVLIADDEPHVLKRLQKRVDWKGLGVDEVLECTDGEEILELLGEGPVDLLVTDIRMARMGGIEAAREARKTLPELPVILMSAYDDKEYLKSALDLQAMGYLEKPFSIEQAEELLKKALTGIRMGRAANSAVEQARKQQHRQECAALADRLCRCTPGADTLAEQARELCPGFAEADSFFAVLFRKNGEEPEPGQEESAREAFSEAFEKTGLLGLYSRTRHGGILCILAVGRETLPWSLDRLRGYLEKPGQPPVWTAAVGSRAEKLALVCHSYQDAVVTMERHFYHSSPVLYFEDASRPPLVFEGEEEDFRSMLENKNRLGCRQYLERLRERLIVHDSTLVRVVKNHYFRLAILTLQNRTDEKEPSVSEYYLWELFWRTDSLEELDRFLKELLNACFPESLSERHSQEQISRILEYIDQNLSDPELSLGEISRRFYLSVTYLCMFFREKTGTTIRAYIIESRMNRAARLLKTTDLRVSEVAAEVGFSDQGYFTKSFGKHFGMSPSRYKEENSEEKKPSETV